MSNIKISKEELQDLHVYFKKSVSEIAREFSLEPWVIRSLLTYFEIPINEDLETQPPPPLVKAAHPSCSDNFMTTLQRLKDHGITYNARHHNTILFHSSNETWKHFMAKCVSCKILRDKGHEIFTEMVVQNAESDILDITDQICYELESTPGSKTFQKKLKKLNECGLDLIVIDLREVPDELEKMIAYFKEKF